MRRERNDICLLHLGGGNHRFIKGTNILYHRFEPIQEHIEWKYRKSLLNEYNDSESNILSVANNQRILHDFLFGEDLEFDNLPVDKRPKTYFPHRTYLYTFKEPLQLGSIKFIKSREYVLERQ